MDTKIGMQIGMQTTAKQNIGVLFSNISPELKVHDKVHLDAGRALLLLALIMGLFSSTKEEACIDVTVEAFSVPFPWRPRQGRMKGTRLAFESNCFKRQHEMLK